MGRAVWILILATVIVAGCGGGGDPIKFSGDVELSTVSSASTNTCVCNTIEDGDNPLTDSRLVGDQVSFSVSNREECLRESRGDIQYSAVTNDPSSHIISGSQCTYIQGSGVSWEDKSGIPGVGGVESFGAARGSNHGSRIPFVTSRKPFPTPPITDGTGVVLQAGVGCAGGMEVLMNDATGLPSQDSRITKEETPLVNLEWEGCKDALPEMTDALINDLSGSYNGFTRTALDSKMDRCVKIEGKNECFTPQGWFLLQDHTYLLPLPAQCSSYSLHIGGTHQLSGITDGSKSPEEFGDRKSFRLVANDDAVFQVDVYEAASGVPGRIEVLLDNVPSAAGISYALICNDPQVDPMALKYVCEAAPYSGQWFGNSDTDGACCYAQNIDGTFTDEFGVTMTCAQNPDDSYEWYDSNIQDNPACGDGVNNGLVTDPTYCCDLEMFEPVRGNVNQQYFCDRGTIDTPYPGNTPFTAPDRDPWAWSGLENTDPDGNWSECTSTVADRAHVMHLCTTDEADKTVFETCKCGESQGSNCGPSQYTDQWYCAPAPTPDESPHWTPDPTTPGACQDNRKINGVCCNPTIYTVGSESFGEDFQETLGCFDGTMLRESFEPLKNVDAGVQG